tara:strand:+ start:871 stop:1578 length:708 start_codon:yes stop_codon:yes gene_type:complete
MKIALILLVFNERECLEILFDQIPKPSFESGYDCLIAIDGGSTDGTVEFLTDRKVPILAQARAGRGEAFQQAFKLVDADGYLFFSPDGNEAISDLTKFKPFLECGAEIVIASRMMFGGQNEEDIQLFRPRKWANKIFNALANLLFRKRGPYITDSINGYRAITKNAVEKLKLDASDYTIEYQMTIRALDMGLNIIEFPTREGQRLAGETGARSIPTGIRFIRRLWREWSKKRVRP